MSGDDPRALGRASAPEPARLIRAHDQFIKLVLDVVANADAFLRERLPAALVARLAATPPVDRSASVISPALSELRGDRVWMLETEDGAPFLVWTLVEHKSAPDPGTLVQLLRTLSGIACRAMVDRRNPDGTVWRVPAPVYPLVLYHGPRRWTLPTELAAAYPLPPGLGASGLLTFTYGLVDLARIPDDQLSRHPELQAGLIALKYALSDDEPETTLERVLRAAADLDLDTVIRVLPYLFRGSDWIDHDKVRAVLARIFPGMEDSVLTPIMRKIIDDARPGIIDEERPKIIDEVRPKIIDEVRPKIIDEVRPGHLREGRVEMLLRQMRRKFGELPDEVVARVRGAKIDQLDDWAERLLDAGSRDELFNDGGRP